MPRTTSLFVCATLLCALVGCGDPKHAAGAIGAPAQKMDPSKMDRSPKSNAAQKVTPVAPVDQKIAPADQKIAPVEQKIAPAEQKVH
jgi:hypothetical protein